MENAPYRKAYCNAGTSKIWWQGASDRYSPGRVSLIPLQIRSQARKHRTSMGLLSWRKSGGISKRRRATRLPAVYINDHKRQKTASQPSVPDQDCQDTEHKQCASAEPLPASKPPSILKKIVTMPVKTLFSRRGAEVHDSTGLDEAVAYYVSARLSAEDQWSGPYGVARHMWG